MLIGQLVTPVVTHFLENISIAWVIQVLPYRYWLYSVVGAFESMASQATNIYISKCPLTQLEVIAIVLSPIATGNRKCFFVFHRCLT